jgi:hypothetical protein
VRGRAAPPLLKVGHRPTPTRKGAGKPSTGGGKSYKPSRGKAGGSGAASAGGGASGRKKRRR